MAKLRVYDLAKELNVESRDVLDMLSTTKFAVKQASNGLDEEAVSFVRNKFKSIRGEKENGKAEPVSGKQTGTEKSGGIRQETAGKESIKPENVQKDLTKQESVQKDMAKQGAVQKDPSKQESGQKNPAKQGAGQKDQAKQESGRRDPSKQEGVRKDSTKKDSGRQDSSRKDSSKKDGARQDNRKKEGDGKERPKKKASISALYNPQYSRGAKQKGGTASGGNTGTNGNDSNGANAGNNTGNSGGSSRNSGSGTNGANAGNNRNRKAAARPQQHSIIKPRPVGERAMRPISERTADNKDDFSDIRMKIERNANNKNERGDRQARGNRSERMDRPERVDRQERTERADRPERVERADRPERAERQDKTAAEKAIRNRVDRKPADKGGRPSDKGGRPMDKGGRPADKGANGRKPAEASKGGGKGNSRGGRFNEMDNSGKKAIATTEDVRSKDSRERNKKKGGTSDHDKLGSRKQENYINLEKRTGRKKPQNQPQAKEDENVIRTLTLPDKLTIRELADKMKVQPSVIVKKLFLKGQMVTVNQEVNFETAEEIALEFNFICEQEEKIDVIAELLKEGEEQESDMVPRPPVVCVMGHVDHGKTSLLDAIRSTRVTDREAGGITQHIGASVVSINDQTITFLDTPGHEAFTAMRMRGANSTDIAILVVAADDGVMPQTVEAINHAKAAGVEIIVAVNKIDKPSANIDKVKQELSEYELIPEDWGGSTVFCPVSAKTKDGIDNLLEMILLTAEVLELKANPKRNARGLVIEAQLDKGRGAVATVLVQKGTLNVGDPIGCGTSYGKIRAMVDDKGRRVKEAGPSTPVEILGLNSVPNAGETFVVRDSEKDAKAFADTFISEEKNKLIEDTKAKMSLDDLFSQIQSGNMKELDIIVKADVQGSVEAVRQSLVKLSNEEVVVKVIHGGVGAINESDVILASASNAIIIGFNVRPDPMAKSTAEREGVDVRLYKVIYNAIEDVEAAMKGMLDPIFEEKVIGHAEIRQIFKASGIGNIAGSYVLDGIIERGCRVRISREGTQIFEGDLASLKRFKDDVKEVRSGYECGLVFDGFGDIQEFDVVEAYKMVEVPR